MNKKFEKLSYKSDIGYRISSTAGFSAEESTLSYLHQTSSCILYYFVHGCGNIKIEGKQYKIKSGDIVILNPKEIFCCSVEPNIYHERIVLHFSLNLFKSFPKNCDLLYAPFLKRKKGHLNHIPAETVRKYLLDLGLKTILEIVQSENEAKEVLALCEITKTLSKLFNIYENYDNKNTINLTENTFINDILAYLNAHYKEDLTIDSIAKEFKIDKSYLSHLFKEYVGTSLWNYIIFRRISCFNEIVSREKSIEEASRLSGFNNYSNFFRLYKKHTGITPMEYKKQNNYFEITL